MKIDSIDHLVLTVVDVEVTSQFYSQLLGMDIVSFGEGRTALQFGNQKINLHQKGKEFEPKAHCPNPGSADLCFLSSTPIDEIVAILHEKQVEIIEGPVERTGATGPLWSVYFRDPDLNLIEVSNMIWK